MLRDLTSQGYRLLVWLLLPKEHRDRCAQAMVELFDEQLGEALERGASAVVRLWLATLHDLTTSTFLVRFRWRSAALDVVGERGPDVAVSSSILKKETPHMDQHVRDMRHAFRGLVRTPTFTVAAILTLGLGVGATTTVFSVADAVVLQALPYADPGQLVYLQEVTPQGIGYSASEPTFLDWREQSTTFESMGAMSGRSFTLSGTGEPRIVSGQAVTGNLTTLLGVPVVHGRGFTEGEDLPGGGGQAVLIGSGLWEQVYGADPGILGKAVVLDDAPHVVVGVFENRDPFFLGVDVLVPLAASPASNRNSHMLGVVGRLAPSSPIASARGDMERVADRVAQQYPSTNGGWGARVTPLHELLLGSQIRTPVFVLLGAVGLVLLIACVNVSNLLLARATTRFPEMGLRTALGAGKGRIARLLVYESLLVALAGSVLGVLFTASALPVVRAMAPDGVPRIEEVTIDGSLLLFSLLCVGVTTVLFGVAPTLRLTSVPPADVLRSGRRAGSRRGSLRDGLVVLELALATIVLTGAGLMLHSFATLTQVDPGFDSEGVYAMRVRIPFQSTVAQVNHLREIETAMRAIPGIASVGSTFVEPFSPGGTANRTAAIDRNPQSADEFTFVAWRSITPGYFEAMGISLMAGEIFQQGPWSDDHRSGPLGNQEAAPAPVSDDAISEPTSVQEGRANFTSVVISKALADIEWPGESAVGRQLYWSHLQGDHFTVVGVVSDVRDANLAADGPPVVYRLFDDRPWPSMSVIFRVDRGTVGVADAVRTVARSVDPGMPTPDTRLLQDNMASSMATTRFVMQLFGVFGVLALLLAATGVYALLSFHVAQRTREIGVRIALGAQKQAVLGMVVREGMTRVAIGLVLGIAGAMAMGRLIASLLYEIEPTDPVTLVGVAATLAVVSLAATAAPAMRAGSMDPTVAFRDD